MSVDLEVLEIMLWILEINLWVWEIIFGVVKDVFVLILIFRFVVWLIFGDGFEEITVLGHGWD